MSPDEAALAADLAGRLLARFERSGRPADLEKAVDLARRSAAQGTGSEQARAMSVLGSALRARFLLTGAAADLDDAVELEERACELVVDDAVRSARYRANLALSLRERFLRRRDPADLDASVRHAEAAVRLGVGADRLERAVWSSNLAAVLGTRHDTASDTTADTTDLDRAVEPPGRPWRRPRTDIPTGPGS